MAASPSLVESVCQRTKFISPLREEVSGAIGPQADSVRQLKHKRGEQAERKEWAERKRCLSCHREPRQPQESCGRKRGQGRHQQLDGDAGNANPDAGRSQKLDVTEPQALIFSQAEEEPAQQPHDRADDNPLACCGEQSDKTLKQESSGKARGRDREVEPVWNDAAAQINKGEQGACGTEQSEKGRGHHAGERMNSVDPEDYGMAAQKEAPGGFVLYICSSGRSVATISRRRRPTPPRRCFRPGSACAGNPRCYRRSRTCARWCRRWCRTSRP